MLRVAFAPITSSAADPPAGTARVMKIMLARLAQPGRVGQHCCQVKVAARCTGQTHLMYGTRCQQNAQPATLFPVKWTCKLVAGVLALSLWGSPLMACMLPDALLTVEERECCKNMANECGQMEMPSSHSCCKVTVRDGDSYLASSRVLPAHSHLVASLLIPRTDFSLPAALPPARPWMQAHSPPVSPPETISILRI